MPQVISPSGILLGNGTYVFTGEGDPNANPAVDVVAAGVGSLFLRTDGPDSVHVLYVCTSRGTDPASGESISVWTAK